MDTIIFDFYRTLFNPETETLFPGCTFLLKKLKKQFQLILVTTGRRGRRKQIAHLQITPLFSAMVVCREKNVELFKRYVSSPSRTLIVGDREESEISIGRRLNTRTLLVNPQQENPMTTISRYLEAYGAI